MVGAQHPDLRRYLHQGGQRFTDVRFLTISFNVYEKQIFTYARAGGA